MTPFFSRSREKRLMTDGWWLICDQDIVASANKPRHVFPYLRRWFYYSIILQNSVLTYSDLFWPILTYYVLRSRYSVLEIKLREVLLSSSSSSLSLLLLLLKTLNFYSKWWTFVFKRMKISIETLHQKGQDDARMVIFALQKHEFCIKQWWIVYQKWGVVYQQWWIVYQKWWIVYQQWWIVYQKWGVHCSAHNVFCRFKELVQEGLVIDVPKYSKFLHGVSMLKQPPGAELPYV